MAERFDSPEPWYKKGQPPVYAHSQKEADKHKAAGYDTTYIRNGDVQAWYKEGSPAIQVNMLSPQAIEDAQRDGYGETPMPSHEAKLELKNPVESQRQVDFIAAENKAMREDNRVMRGELDELKGMLRMLLEDRDRETKEPETAGKGRKG